MSIPFVKKLDLVIKLELSRTTTSLAIYDNFIRLAVDLKSKLLNDRLSSILKKKMKIYGLELKPLLNDLDIDLVDRLVKLALDLALATKNTTGDLFSFVNVGPYHELFRVSRDIALGLCSRLLLLLACLKRHFCKSYTNATLSYALDGSVKKNRTAAV